MYRLVPPSLISVITLSVGLGATGCSERATPEVALQEMITAIEDRDRLRVETLIDEERLAANLADQAAAADQQGGEQTAEAQAIDALARPARVAAAQALIRSTIQTLTDANRDEMETEMLRRLRIGHVRQVDDAADLEVLVEGDEGEEPIRLTARMARLEGKWKMTGLEGFNEIR